MVYDPTSAKHYQSLSRLEGIALLAAQYAEANADWLVDDMTALSAFVSLRRGLDALKDHHLVLETLAGERRAERRAS